jgi:hypothetical protein
MPKEAFFRNAAFSAGLLPQRTMSTPRRKPLPAIASAQARRAGLCGLLNTLIFIKTDVKSRSVAGPFEKIPYLCFEK